MEKIKKYVERFRKQTAKNCRYGLKRDEFLDLIHEVKHTEDTQESFDFVTLLFNFGYAKGYRAAKAEKKK